MDNHLAKRKKQVGMTAVIILLVGFLGSAIIYFTAGNEPDAETAYQLKLEDSKRYVHDLELFGGKANVLANEFQRWFGDLWAGKRLASTVAWITVVVFAAFLFLANRLNPEPHTAASDDEAPTANFPPNKREG